jgi:hypothetical protein
MSSRKTKKQMVRGNRTDEIGRLDHTRMADNRAKNKRNWKQELEKDAIDALKEWDEIASHFFGDD